MNVYMTLQLQANAFQTITFRRYESVTRLDISKNPLRDLTKFTFQYKFPNLRKLYMSACGLSILPSGLLNTLFFLRHIDLRCNGLMKIPANFFQNLMFLESVILKENKLEYLDDNTFTDCKNIKDVDLDSNHLKSLGNAFKDASSSLKNLSLRNNEFGVLRADEFKYLTSLEYLEITMNKIFSLETIVFQKMKNLRTLKLGLNRISSLNYSINGLRSLQFLHLQYNRLEVITENDMFGLVQLKYLNLRGNKLKNVNGAFRMLSNLIHLNLKKNKLTTLTRTSFPETHVFREIILYSNKWVCDCRLQWLQQLFIERNVTGEAGALYCNMPKNFQTKKLVDLSVSDLVQWPEEKCSPCDCSCVDEGNGDFFVRVDCSRKNISEIPSVLPEQTGELFLNDNLLTRFNLSSKTLNKLKTVDVERNHLRNLNFEIPQGVTTMKLAGNKLTRFFDKPPSNVLAWTLAENPWLCDCETKTFRKWLLKHINNISDIRDVRCENPESGKSLHNKVTVELLDSDLCPFIVSSIIIASVCILFLLLLGTSSSLLYSRYHYHIKVWLHSRGHTWLKKKEEDDDRGKIYDAFISSADEDILWVKDVLLPELEEKYPYYSVYEPRKHMMGGEICAYEKELEVASQSRRVIVLLSRNYIQNNFLMGIFKASLVNSLEEKKYRLIIIIIGDLPPLSNMDPSLKAAVESTKCLRFGRKLFWEMLRFAMPKTSRKKQRMQLRRNI